MVQQRAATWAILLLAIPLSTTRAQVIEPEVPSPYGAAYHNINKVKVAVSDRALIVENDPEVFIYDPFTGELIYYPLEYPRGSGDLLISSLGLWVGARTRTGVHVSGSNWWWPRYHGDFGAPPGPTTLRRRSTLVGSSAYGPDAVSEEDILCNYSDIYSPSNPDGLGIEVHQASYGWSVGYAEDFIIFDLDIANQSDRKLEDVYIALLVNPYCGSRYGSSWRDDLIGFQPQLASQSGCGLMDSLNLFWWSDNDGDPYEGKFIVTPVWAPEHLGLVKSTRGVAAIEVFDAPLRPLPTSYNWWVGIDTIPQEVLEPCRVGNGDCDAGAIWNQESDRTFYDHMANGEFDYEPLAARSMIRPYPTDDWVQLSRPLVDLLAAKGKYFFMPSWGPMTLPPGAHTALMFALVCGENFHTDPNNLSNVPDNMAAFKANLDFSDLAQNALMAGWVYDNPGVDTDGDGYFGEFRICVHDSSLIDGNWVATRADTQWYKGDGVPDYRGELPPPAPELWVSQIRNGLHIRLNGQYSETEKDIFLQKPDWEGYRIYVGRDERETSLSLVGSYDKLDFDKYYYNLTLADGPEWQLLDEPFSLEELRCLYGGGPDPCEDSTFDPLIYTQTHWYRDPHFPDSIFMFKAHDYNTSDLGYNTPVHKTYPDAPDPRLLPADSITPDMYTEDGYLKFYEYEMDVENLLPSVEYYVSATAIDFGSPAQGLNPLESSKLDNLTPAFPLHETDQPLSGNEKVYVYPNPYRIDAGYRDNGYEGRGQDDAWDERVRSIWFANLPPKCTINIFTLDGDRVRTLHHDVPITDPTYSKERWDLINRNYQIIVSGIYYWTVEAPDRETQIGKLVILR